MQKGKSFFLPSIISCLLPPFLGGQGEKEGKDPGSLGMRCSQQNPVLSAPAQQLS